MSIGVGDVLLDQYRILEHIGEGGMARVWLAKKLVGGDRLFAIKEPRSDLAPAGQEEVARRFVREVDVCAKLAEWGTPNIVHTYPALSYNNSQLLVMDYMLRGDLATRIANHPNGMPFDEVITIASSLLTALESVHNHPLGIVHRDLKPSNVLFDKNNVAHLADFGLAQIATYSEGRTQLSGPEHPGTSLYKAPEQEESRGYLVPAADLFALGCVLFEMLTGKPYKAQMSRPLASKLRSDTPAWLDQLVSKALEKNPEDRYQSAAEMRKALEMRGSGASSSVKSTPKATEESKQPSEAKTKNPGPAPEKVRPVNKNRNWVYALAVLALTFFIINLYQSRTSNNPSVAESKSATVAEVPSATATPMPMAVSSADRGASIVVVDTPTPVRENSSPAQPTATPTFEHKPASVDTNKLLPLIPLPGWQGNISVCVPRDIESRAVVHLWRLSAEGTWEEEEKRSAGGGLDSNGMLKIDGNPIDSTYWGSSGQPYRLELWVDSVPVKSFGNTDEGEAEFRVYKDMDNIAPDNAFCN